MRLLRIGLVLLIAALSWFTGFNTGMNRGEEITLEYNRACKK